MLPRSIVTALALLLLAGCGPSAPEPAPRAVPRAPAPPPGPPAAAAAIDAAVARFDDGDVRAEDIELMARAGGRGKDEVETRLGDWLQMRDRAVDEATLDAAHTLGVDLELHLDRLREMLIRGLRFSDDQPYLPGGRLRARHLAILRAISGLGPKAEPALDELVLILRAMTFRSATPGKEAFDAIAEALTSAGPSSRAPAVRALLVPHAPGDSAMGAGHPIVELVERLGGATDEDILRTLRHDGWECRCEVFRYMERAKTKPSRAVIPAMLDVAHRPRMGGEGWLAVDLLVERGDLESENRDLLLEWARTTDATGAHVLAALGEPGLDALGATLDGRSQEETEARLEAAARGLAWRRNAWSNAVRERYDERLAEVRESWLDPPVPDDE